jgi:3-oxoacyl-[acyl-carrier protein] reductase
MDLGISNRVAMVAASSKGLGKAVALSLAREGCWVSLCGRNADTLAATLDELKAAHPSAQHMFITCDVTKEADLGRWFRATSENLGPVDILVTNTGGPPAATFLNLSEEQWASGVDSTLMNVVRLSRLALPGMRERKWGRIVHLTSLVAKQPLPLLTISSTLRAGISALTRTLATEFAREGVTINALLPGHILTDRQVHLAKVRAEKEGISTEQALALNQAAIPLGRFGRPEEIGDAAAFLCSERAAYITGTSLQVDGGVIQSTF